MGSKISVFIIVVVMIVIAGVLADAPMQEVVDGDDERSIQTYEEIEQNRREGGLDHLVFENFLITEDVYAGDAAVPNFSTNPLARNFEEIITASIESVGVNFAGAYNVSTWSCGPGCQNSAIVDLRDGSIPVYGLISMFGLSFSKESTLLVVNPKINMGQDAIEVPSVETDYHVLEDGELKLIAKETREDGILADCIQAIANARNTITNEVLVFPTPCVVPYGWEIIGE